MCLIKLCTVWLHTTPSPLRSPFPSSLYSGFFACFPPLSLEAAPLAHPALVYSSCAASCTANVITFLPPFTRSFPLPSCACACISQSFTRIIAHPTVTAGNLSPLPILFSSSVFFREVSPWIPLPNDFQRALRVRAKAFALATHRMPGARLAQLRKHLFTPEGVRTAVLLLSLASTLRANSRLFLLNPKNACFADAPEPAPSPLGFGEALEGNSIAYGDHGVGHFLYRRPAG